MDKFTFTLDKDVKVGSAIVRKGTVVVKRGDQRGIPSDKWLVFCGTIWAGSEAFDRMKEMVNA